jgi:3-oxoacyl-[acyl-carrier-protein] synthase II
MPDRRAAITGLGVVSPLGIGVEETFQALLEGKSGLCTFDLFDPGKFPITFAGQINDFSARKFVLKSYRKAVKVMARDIEIAVAAADLAFRDAAIDTKGTNDDGEMTVPAKRIGCNIGAGLICTELNELGVAINTAVADGKFDYKLWGEQGINNLTPLWLLKYLPNMLSCHVTIIHGAEGPSNCITCGDASGHLAAAEGAMYIHRNTADVAIIGGAESKLNPMGTLRQGLLHRLCTSRNDQPQTAIRPFDADHAGTAIGEGGGLVIVEELQHARDRNATIYAEVAGYGAACDPQGINIEEPTAGNLALAAKNAMKMAGVTPDEVDAIVTYGTGVPGEDLAEAAEWKKALGEEKASLIPAVSFTGSLGTLYAGTAGVQLALAAKAMQAGQLPPTVNHARPAEGCELNLSNKTRTLDLNCVVVGAYTVGGQSGAVVLRKV